MSLLASRNRSFTAALLLIVLFGMALKVQSPVRDSLRSGARSVASVAWVAAHGIGDTFDHYGGISTRATLAGENAALKAEIARLESLSLHNDVLRSENATLRDMFSLREAHPEGIATPVLSNPAVSPYGTFVIGGGTDDGIAVGMYVLSAPRVAIGRVIEADSRTALVDLFSAPGKETEVVIEDVRTTYFGRGDGNGLVVIPRGSAIAEGDAVQLPGQQFAIGFVGYIESKPEDAETKVLVRVPANLPSLSFVYVVPGE